MIEKFTKSIKKVRPDHIKKIFYNLPLLVNWLPGITFEKDADWIKMSERSMGLSLLFMAGLLFISILYFFVNRLTPGTEQYIPNMIGFTLHSILATVYNGTALYFTAAELLNKKIPDFLSNFFIKISHEFRDLFA